MGERTARLYKRPRKIATRGAIELETNREMIRGWQLVQQSSPRHMSQKTAFRNADHTVIARMIRGESLWVKRDGCPARLDQPMGRRCRKFLRIPGRIRDRRTRERTGFAPPHGIHPALHRFPGRAGALLIRPGAVGFNSGKVGRLAGAVLLGATDWQGTPAPTPQASRALWTLQRRAKRVNP